MQLETFEQFLDFELLDTGDGYRLEQWGPVRLQRPDPQIIWSPSLPQSEWDQAQAVFIGNGERGKWQKRGTIPEKWEVYFRPDIKLWAKLTPFKHTGIFAEQAANWEWMIDITSPNLSLKGGGNYTGPLKILNLFAYTGGATMVLTRLGHQVTHVDASKPSIASAKENQKLNKFEDDAIRWILDDALKFCEREVKRGAKYDGIILDPPAFGHSPTGKTWKFNRDVPKLLDLCAQLLSEDAKFLLMNAYATNTSSLALNNLMEEKFRSRGGKVTFGELCLKEKTDRLISTGTFAKWEN